MNKKVVNRIVAAFTLMVLSACVIVGQTDSPETPVVVSRDESVTEKKEDVPADDVRESTVTAKSGQDPAAPEIVLPRSTSAPYNISLSEAQQKMMLYLDILTKTEARAELLRTKLFEMIEKENSVLANIRQIEYSLRPEQIQNVAALSGSLRPENIRAERASILESDKKNLEALLNQIRTSRRSLENAIEGADRLVERVRAKFSSFVDAALEDGADF